jgi:hypothetical protein
LHGNKTWLNSFAKKGSCLCTQFPLLGATKADYWGPWSIDLLSKQLVGLKAQYIIPSQQRTVTQCREVASKVKSWRNAVGRDWRTCFSKFRTHSHFAASDINIELEHKVLAKCSFLIQNKMLSEGACKSVLEVMVTHKIACLRIRMWMNQDQTGWFPLESV